MFPNQSNPVRVLFTGDAVLVTLGAAIEAFMRAEMIGLSSQTVVWYRRRLDDLAESLGLDRPLSDLMEADLIEYYRA